MAGRDGHTSQVLCIPAWFDPQVGHELPLKQGCYMKSPLAYFISRVHPGNGRAELRRRFGADAEDACVSLYDRLCQLAANQPLDRRGKLFDPFGAPYTVETLSGALCRAVEWVADKLEKLAEVGWVQWVAPDFWLTGHPLTAETFGKIPKDSEKGSALTKQQQQHKQQPKPKPQQQPREFAPESPSPSPDEREDENASLALPAEDVDVTAYATNLLVRRGGLKPDDAIRAVERHGPEEAHRRLVNAEKRKAAGKINGTLAGYLYGALLKGD